MVFTIGFCLLVGSPSPKFRAWSETAWVSPNTEIGSSYKNLWFWPSTLAKSTRVLESATKPETAQAIWLSILITVFYLTEFLKGDRFHELRVSLLFHHKNNTFISSDSNCGRAELVFSQCLPSWLSWRTLPGRYGHQERKYWHHGRIHFCRRTSQSI